MNADVKDAGEQREPPGPTREDEIREMGLAEKIWNVQQDFYLQKSGWNETLRYKYLQESEVVKRILELCQEYRLLVVFTQDDKATISSALTSRRGEPMTGIVVTLMYEIFDLDAKPSRPRSGMLALTQEPPDRLSVLLGQDLRSQGFSADSSDKALFKARTGAKKYALLETFMAVSGDDPELPGAADERPDKAGGQKHGRQNQSRGNATPSNKALPQQIERWFKTQGDRKVPWKEALDSLRKTVTRIEIPADIEPVELQKFMAQLSLKEMNSAINALPHHS